MRGTRPTAHAATSAPRRNGPRPAKSPRRSTIWPSKAPERAHLPLRRHQPKARRPGLPLRYEILAYDAPRHLTERLDRNRRMAEHDYDGLNRIMDNPINNLDPLGLAVDLGEPTSTNDNAGETGPILEKTSQWKLVSDKGGIQTYELTQSFHQRMGFVYTNGATPETQDLINFFTDVTDPFLDPPNSGMNEVMPDAAAPGGWDVTSVAPAAPGTIYGGNTNDYPLWSSHVTNT
jgi:hypothetical protein